jgi:hypothetical protein
VLIVARQTATSIELQEAVAERIKDGVCDFTLLVPAEVHGLHRVVDPEEHGVEEAEHTIATAAPLLSRAAGREVHGMVGSHDPLAATADAINLHGFDEAIVSMLQPRLSRWLHLDLARKIAAMAAFVTPPSWRPSVGADSPPEGGSANGFRSRDGPLTEGVDSSLPRPEMKPCLARG